MDLRKFPALAPHCLTQKRVRLHRCRGQAIVELTLVFMLLLVVVLIPADFGLAFFTGQLALNASREGARIGAATNPFDANDVLTETCKRLPSALLIDPAGNCLPYSRARVIVDPPSGSACNQQLAVTVIGDYNYFFLGLLGYFGAPVPSSATITRVTQMRWEHQSTCS